LALNRRIGAQNVLVQRTHNSIFEALSTPRFEVIPMKGVLEQVVHLPQSATVTVTCSPVHGIEPTLRVIEKLSSLGFQAVPHISGRMVTSYDHLDEIVDRLIRAGVRDIYVIGGDARTPLGPFSSAGAFLEALHERGSPFDAIGVAGYPEGHPLVDEDRLWEALHDKQSLATYVVTQMCFDPEAIVRWVTEARQRGIVLPALVGIPGCTSRAHLLRIASRIGVGQSARFLNRHAGMLARMLRPGSFCPDDLVDELSPAMSDPLLDIRGFHIYTFNYVEQTERWRQHRLDGATQ
jgi:methylenetetrahydrofolate reductase (NADPH)